MTKKSNVINNPKLKVFVEELEGILESIEKDPDTVANIFNANKRTELLNATQLHDIVTYALELIVPTESNAKNIQEQLIKLHMFQDIRISKNSQKEPASIITNLRTPRTLIFLKTAAGHFQLGIMTLSKNSLNQKIPINHRMRSYGSTKTIKTFHTVNTILNPDNIDNSMVRLHIDLGSTNNNYVCMENYKRLWMEVVLANALTGQHDKYIAKPLMGKIYEKFMTVQNRNGMHETSIHKVINIYDTQAISLTRFMSMAENPSFFKNGILVDDRDIRNSQEKIRLTATEQADIIVEKDLQCIPRLYWQMAHQLLLATKLMHDSSVIHRDIKPCNILVDRDPNGKLYVKITDFGLALDFKVWNDNVVLLLELLGYKNTYVKNSNFICYNDSDNIIRIICNIFESINANIEAKINKKDLRNVPGLKIKMQKHAQSIINSEKEEGFYGHQNMLLDPPTIQSLNARAEYYLKQLGYDTNRNPINISEEPPLTTTDYVAPEILQTLTTFDHPLNPKNLEPHVLALQQFRPLTIDPYIEPYEQPDPKQDIYALGITLFELFFGHYPNMNTPEDLQIIQTNEFFIGMLNANFKQRFNIDQAIASFMKWGTPTPPPNKRTSPRHVSGRDTKKHKPG